MRRSWQGKRRWLDVSDFRRRRSLVPRSNSKAVGDDQTGGLALSPYVPFSRTVIVGLSEPGSGVCCGFHLRPILPLKEERDAPILRTKHIAPHRPPPLCSEHSVRGTPGPRVAPAPATIM